MKKYMMCILGLLMLLTTVSCDSKNLKKKYEIPSFKDTDSSYTSSNDPIPVNSNSIDKQHPYDQLITKTCDIHYVAEKYFIRNFMGRSSTLSDISADIGVECLRETDAGAFYSVHRVKQGGLLYIFYTNFPEHNNVGDIIRLFYVQKNLSYKDFSKIKAGSTIDDVKKIDPIAQIFENIYNSNPDYWNASGGFGSYHYLSDGVLEFGYKYKDGKLTVTQQNLIEDFQLRQNASRSYPYDGHILPMDLVK